MTDGYLIIDLGSTKTDIVLYDGSLECRGRLSFSTREMRYDGYACINPQQYVEDLLAAIAELSIAASAARRVAVAVTGMGSTLLVATPSGRIAYPSIGWQEEARCAAGIDHEIGFTGKVPVPTYPLYKLAGLKSSVTDERHVFAALPDYVTAALIGFERWVTDRSFASRSMLYDDYHQRWDLGLVDALQITTDNLPQVVDAGTVIGAASPAICNRAGLPRETMVLSGLHDHIATGYAAMRARSVLGRHMLINPAGTTESVMEFVRPSFATVREAPTQLLNTEATWDGELLALLSYPTLSGKVLDAAKILSIEWDVSAKLFRSRIVVAPPRRRLRVEDKGLVLGGASISCTLQDLWESLIVATQYELRKSVAELVAFSGTAEYEGVLLLGGQVQSPQLRMLKSVVLGLPVYSFVRHNFTTLGAALLVHDRLTGDGASGTAAMERVLDEAVVEQPLPELAAMAEVAYNAYLRALKSAEVPGGVTA